MSVNPIPAGFHTITNSVRIMGWIVGWKFPLFTTKSFETWWPGTELNRRRQPFQGYVMLWSQQLK